MRFKVIGDSLGIILMFFSLTFLLPIATAIWYDEGLNCALFVYGIPALSSLIIGSLMRFYARGYSETLRDREAFVVVGLAWLPPIADASTGTITLAVAMPIHRADGAFAGVTAIDVPLPGMFMELRLPDAWAGKAKAMLVAPSRGGGAGGNKQQ